MTSENDNQNRNYIEWLRQEIDYYGRYHDHKETMAWAATAFYIVGILTLASYLGSVAHGYWRILPAIFVALSGFLIFRFIYWQFRKRWIASVKVYRYKQTLLKEVFGFEHPSQNEETCKRQISDREKDEPGKNDSVISCHQWKLAFKSILPWLDSKLGEKYQPLVSEAITYVAISIVTIVGIVLVYIN